MALFQTGEFRLHSGKSSAFKIDCDALHWEDWATVAALIAKRYTFGAVQGIPRGGLWLAEHLASYITPSCPIILVVDDVATTGQSFLPYANDPRYQCVVVFARGEMPPYVEPMFQLSWLWWHE